MKFKRSTIGLRLSGFFLLSVVLMAADHRHESILQPVRYVLSGLVWPIQYIVDHPFRLISEFSDHLYTREALLYENEQFRAKQSLLEFQLQRLVALESENKRLQHLLGAASIEREGVQVADVLQVDMRPFSQKITLNKGLYHGVYRGQPVVNAQGVVGQITEVTPMSSTVLLISDITHAIPIQNNRDNTRVIAVGTGSSYELELSYVPNGAHFMVGDILVTSGLGDRFPSGYPVGAITEIDINPEAAFMRVKVKPAVELDKIREVLLILPRQDEHHDKT